MNLRRWFRNLRKEVVVMAKGKPVPIEDRFPDPTKISAVIDKTDKLELEIIAGELVPKFGFAPTQGQVISYLIKQYRKK